MLPGGSAVLSRRRTRNSALRDDRATFGGRARGFISTLLATLLAALAVVVVPGSVVAADPSVLKVDPATLTVAPNETFAVTIVQSAAVATTGAQVNVVFDAKALQLQDFELGPAYAAANAVIAYGNSDLGTSGDKAAMIARTNKFGVLENAAGFLLPGSGTIPPGETVFLKLTFASRAGASGDARMTLIKGSMIDEQGQPLVPKMTRAIVTVDPKAVPRSPAPVTSAEPGTSAAPGTSAEPGSSAPASPAVTAPVPPVSPTGTVRMGVAPTTLDLKAGDGARIFLYTNADGNLYSAAADLTFDKDKLQVTGVEVGQGWDGATAIAVTTDKTNSDMNAAITEANTTGVLQQVGAFFPPGYKDLAFGESVFVSVLLTAKVDGTSTVSIGNVGVLGATSETLPVEVDPASFTKPPEKGIVLDPTLVIPLVLLLVVVLAGIIVIRSGRIPVRVRRRWPFYVSLVLGLVPVVLFAFMVVALIVNAAPIVVDPGIGALFGGQFLDAKGNLITGYQILPPIWITILTTGVAMIVALPIALALAVVAVDFPMGPIGRLVQPIVSLLSGIPPIVYAVAVPGFVAAFMIPKFAANMIYDDFVQGGPAAIGADPATWPPAGVPFNAGAYPWDWLGGNSILLGGLIVGLFLIPFVTPLFVDALRNVPRAAREGSLALGANRTYTLRRVVLPRALPAIAGASTLAVLKAMGDAVILLFASGAGRSDLPTPVLDVLERGAAIGAWGANLIGSFDVLDQNCSAQQCAVGYTSALLLLVAAGAMVIAMSVLQGRGRRRVAV